MATELRRSFKEKAKVFTFKIKGRSEPETPPEGLQAVPPAGGSEPGVDLGEGGGVATARPGVDSPAAAGPVSGEGGAGVAERPGGEPEADPAAHFTFNPLSYTTGPPTMRHKPAAAKDAEEHDGSGSLGRQDSKRKSRQLQQPKGSLTYEVCGNDTMMSIAAKVDSTTSELKKLNKLMTPMVFPGQVIYIPDKDYVPSSPSSENSPTHPPLSPGSDPEHPLSPEAATAADASKPIDSPRPAFTTLRKLFFWEGKDIPLIRSYSEKSKGPGLAERLKLGDLGGSGNARHHSDTDAKKIDSECHERFIKVNVKHITDGQGVVNGVLLVTPNAIMFDPNLSDPLVVDRGADEYGMIAPMETVISAAMYHDIAAMKKTLLKDEEPSTKSKVYHAPTCAMSLEKADDKSQDELFSGVEDKKVGDTEPCSCSPSRAVDAKSARISGEADTQQGLNKVTDTSALSEPGASATQQAPSTSDETSADVANAADNSSGHDLDLHIKPADTVSLDSSHSPDVTSDRAPGAEAEECSTADSTVVVSDASMPDLIKDLKPATTLLEGVVPLVVDSGAPVSGEDGASATKTDGSPALTPSLTSGMQIGSIQYFQYETDNSAPVKAPVGEVSSGAPKSPGLDPGATSHSGDASPSRDGIFKRTLAPLNSLRSSLPGSPNFSSFVDFSTGLFSRSPDQQGRVKDGIDYLMHEGAQAVEAGVAVGRNTFYPDMNGVPPTDSSSISRKGSRRNNKDKHLSLSDIDVSVQNAVRMEDMPELFRDLDELVPRPATHFEDPPLYLCLRIGRPTGKRVSRTCPIEAYVKNKNKPEYWFSIPREKVDALYAFFIQWSPSIYGTEEEVDAEQRGFLVVGDADLEDMDLIEDHFTSTSPLSRAITKDWEIVNQEEAIRRITLQDLESLPLPDLLNNSSIMDDMHIRKLSVNMPARAEGYAWSLIYSSEKHGFSLKTLYRNMYKIDSPVLLVVKDTFNQVFGALCSCALHMSDHFYGTGESYLFSFYNQFTKYAWTGGNNFFIKGNAESLAIGAGEGSFGLWLDGDLYHGHTQFCHTYNNDLLTESEDFVVKGIEAWGFV